MAVIELFELQRSSFLSNHVADQNPCQGSGTGVEYSLPGRESAVAGFRGRMGCRTGHSKIELRKYFSSGRLLDAVNY